MRENAEGGPTKVMLDTLRLTALRGSTAHLEAETPQALSFAIGKVERLTAMLSAGAGRSLRVALALRPGASAGAPPAHSLAAAPGGDPRAAADAVPIVKRAIELFDARVVRVEDDPPGR